MAQVNRELKRSEYLFHEGEKSDSIFMIEKGKISLCIEKGSHKIELQQLSAGQIVGIGALLGLRQHTISAYALQNTNLVEMPASVAKQSLESGSPIAKLITKSLLEQWKVLQAEYRTFKLEKETAPCPQIRVPTIFSILNYVIRYTGKAGPDSSVIIIWSNLKTYAVKMFLDSPERMDNICKILSKLGHAELKYIKPEDAENENELELNDIIIYNPDMIGEFADFFAYNLYKKSQTNMLSINERCLKIALVIAQNYYDIPVDHKNATKVDHARFTDDLAKAGIQYKAQDITLMESKGLFLNTVSSGSTSQVSFDYKEIANTAMYWQIIHEIDKWNERGSVVMDDKETANPVLTNANCPSCKAAVSNEQKFCAQCGHKLTI